MIITIQTKISKNALRRSFLINVNKIHKNKILLIHDYTRDRKRDWGKQ